MVATKRAPKQAAKSVRRSSAEYSSVRKSCAPGTVAIVLAGRFRGRRVVILKQLPRNGPLVISGPMKYNGVPLRRIDSRYLIATSTKIDLSGVDTTAITPEVFARAKSVKPAKSEEHFMGDRQKAVAERRARKTSKAASGAATRSVVSDARAQLQKSIDSALIAAIKRNKEGSQMAGYLRSVFTIKSGDAPHRWNWNNKREAIDAANE